MSSRIRYVACCSMFLMGWVCVSALIADEGMWLFNALPRQYLQQKYGFDPSDAWAQNLMRASVRFNSGGSASFVSSTGLVLTNHHVGADTLQKISTPERNYYETGFLATTLADEIPAPDLELNQLVSIEDVTERVNSAVKPGMAAAAANAARRAIQADIEQESLEKTGLRSDVVTLYGGGRYHLYRYKKYTDVRLVWAPEFAAAFFGGDADNFEYPRFDLDACIFRVYEDGKPLHVEHFLKWSDTGAADGELVFVSGNPGRTSRIDTVDALKQQRDRLLPLRLDMLRRREILLQQFSLDGPEPERRAHEDLFGVQNSRKAISGMLGGLLDPAIMGEKESSERELISALQKNESLRKYLGAWDRIREIEPEFWKFSQTPVTIRSQLFSMAQMLLRIPVEDQKPSGERLREYRDSNRESLTQQLFSPAPIYPDLETTLLADGIAYLAETRGGDDPLVVKILDGKGPQARAEELVRGTRLFDVAFRKELAQGGAANVDSCQDPMIALARLIDPQSRAQRTKMEELQEVERQAYAQISEAIFATRGTSTYPDATFTLRLAFGPVKGYSENGAAIPPWTTFGGAFEHEKAHGAVDPWKLPARWHERKNKLDLMTPLNFVCTADIIGGNSGSPVVNRRGELVGLIFDGNIQSLTADYIYTDEQSRAVAVHSSAIREALRRLYDASKLADELGH